MENSSRILLGALVVSVGLLAIVGGGTALVQDTGSPVVSDVDDSDSVSASNVSLTEQEAIDIATAEINGTVDEVELDTETQAPVYEVELIRTDSSEATVTIHANNGTVLETEIEDDDAGAVRNVSLTEQEAIDIATAEVNGTVEKVELEKENSTPVYEVKLVATNSSEVEVSVHADTGAILETEADAERDDNHEADDESVSASNVSLTEQEAIDIATAEANGTIDEVELEKENGTPVYEVTLVTTNGSEVDVSVHANDGGVLEIDHEIEDKSHDEEDDDESDDDERDDDESDDDERDDDESDDDDEGDDAEDESDDEEGDYNENDDYEDEDDLGDDE